MEPGGGKQLPGAVPPSRGPKPGVLSAGWENNGGYHLRVYMGTSPHGNAGTPGPPRTQGARDTDPSAVGLPAHARSSVQEIREFYGPAQSVSRPPSPPSSPQPGEQVLWHCRTAGWTGYRDTAALRIALVAVGGGCGLESVGGLSIYTFGIVTVCYTLRRAFLAFLFYFTQPSCKMFIKNSSILYANSL